FTYNSFVSKTLRGIAQNGQITAPRPLKSRPNSFVCETLHITHLFLRLCEEFVPKSLILHGRGRGRGADLLRLLRCCACRPNRQLWLCLCGSAVRVESAAVLRPPRE